MEHFERLNFKDIRFFVLNKKIRPGCKGQTRSTTLGQVKLEEEVVAVLVEGIGRYR